MEAARIAAVAAVITGGYATLVRPRLLRWGATPEEATGPYPGDRMFPGGARGSTMAATVQAPPAEVWSWLVQMGHDRAGWYSWDLLDNFGQRSADRIHPEWQDIAVGDRLRSTPDGTHWFDVAAVEPERFLALTVSADRRGRQVASGGLRRSVYRTSAWCFQLRPLPEGGTRLVVRVYDVGPHTPVQTLAKFLFWEPAHWIMQMRQFANVKRRAEHPSADRAHPSIAASGAAPEPAARYAERVR